MVIILQLFVFIVFAVLRGRTLFGAHLQPIEPGSDVLVYNLRISSQRLALHVGLARSGAIPFIVRRERPYHALLKAIGMSSEINVGNPDFDDRYFITTDFPGHLEQLLASENLQRHVNQLFELPVKSLHANRRQIWCVIAAEDIAKPDDYFDAHRALLREIFEDTRAARARGNASPGWRWQGMAALSFIAVQAGLLAFGLLGFIPNYGDSVHTTSMGQLVLMGIGAGMLAAAVWLLLALGLFLGSSWCAWVLADFVLCGLLGFALTGISVVREVNIHLPQPEARIYLQPVVQKVCELHCERVLVKRTLTSLYAFDTDAACSPSSRQQNMELKRRVDSICAHNAWFGYRLAVRHWRKSSSYSFTTGVELFDAVKTGDNVRLSVHPGALRVEWLDWDEITAR